MLHTGCRRRHAGSQHSSTALQRALRIESSLYQPDKGKPISHSDTALKKRGDLLHFSLEEKKNPMGEERWRSILDYTHSLVNV